MMQSLNTQERNQMNDDRVEFETTIRENFKVPPEAFLTRTEKGYRNGHLNAYYKVWRLAKGAAS